MKMPFRPSETASTADQLRRLARWWVAAAFIGTVSAIAVRSMTAGATAHDWEPAVWAITAGALLLATLFMWWSDGLTSAWLGLVAVVWGVGISAHYGVLMGAIPVVVLGPPSILFFLAWHHIRSRGEIAVFATAVVLILAGGGFAAHLAYDSVFGPTHPESMTPAPPPSPVQWMWSGSVTPTAFTVTAGIEGSPSAALTVYVDGETVASIDEATTGTPPIARFLVDGLIPGTRYEYEVSTAAGTGPRGSVSTFTDGPVDISIAFSSCARLGSNGSVFDAIKAASPDLYVITGDLFYGDIGPNDPDAFAEAYAETLTRPAQAALYRSVPIAYVWDDHDYALNDSDAESPSRPAAMSAYRSFVPHYPLAGDDGPIYQSLTLGRVRVVITDTRSVRTESGILGAEQTGWLESQLAAAEAQGQLVLWVNPDPWITVDDPGADHWGGFPEERRSVARMIASFDITLVMLGGDAHMVAIDDGRNNTFAGDEQGFVVFHAGALDRPGSLKGGPYSHGAFPGGGQYGLVDIHDDGESLLVTLRALDWEGTPLTQYSFEVIG